MLMKLYGYLNKELRWAVEFAEKYPMPCEMKLEHLAASDSKATAVLELRMYFELRGIPIPDNE